MKVQYGDQVFTVREPFPFRQARIFKRPAAPRTITQIVMHTMQAREGPNTAEGCAAFFQSAAAGGSAHYCVDENSVVQCVMERDQAAGAPGANTCGLHVEMEGFAEQTAAQWDDESSQRMLAIAAALVARRCRQYGIPVRWLLPPEVRAGERGITSHNNVTIGWRDKYPQYHHWDPGDAFPVGRFLRLVREEQARL